MKTIIPAIAILSLTLALPVTAATASDSAAQRPPEKTLIWPDGTRYIGGVKQGKRSGKGTIIWKDGTRFVGTFKNDKRNGPGTMILPDGTIYNGYFKDDQLVDAPPAPADGQSGPESVAIPEEVPPKHESPKPAIPVSGKIASRAGTGETAEPPKMMAAETTPVETPIRPTPRATTAKPAAPAPAMPKPATSKPSSPKTANAPKPPAKPLSVARVTSLTPGVKANLAETVKLWAAAWSEKNVVQYLANYSEDFRPSHHRSRKHWAAMRRARITKPHFIKVDVDFRQFKIVKPDTAEVYFRQSYKSDRYSDVTNKVLTLQKEGHYWRIIKESH